VFFEKYFSVIAAEKYPPIFYDTLPTLFYNLFRKISKNFFLPAAKHSGLTRLSETMDGQRTTILCQIAIETTETRQQLFAFARLLFRRRQDII
jgi:hypothetical protein